MGEIERTLTTFCEDIRTTRVASFTAEDGRKRKFIEIGESFIAEVGLPRLLKMLDDISWLTETQRELVVQSVIFLIDLVKDVMTLEKTLQLLCAGMSSTEYEVRKPCSKKLCEIMLSFSATELKTNWNSSIPEILIQSVCDPDMAVCKDASKALFHVVRSGDLSTSKEVQSGLINLASNLLQKVLEGTSDKKFVNSFNKSEASTYFLRAVHLAACMSSSNGHSGTASDEIFSLSKKTFETDDFLLQLSLFSVLPLFLTNKSGVDLFVEKGMFDVLIALETDRFLSDYALKLLCLLAPQAARFKSPRQAEMQKATLEIISQKLSSINPKDTPNACSLLRLIGLFIGLNPSVLDVLEDEDVTKWCELAVSGNEDVLVAGLDSLANSLEAGTFDPAPGKLIESIFSVTDETSVLDWSPWRKDQVLPVDMRISRDLKKLVIELFKAFKKIRAPKLRMPAPSTIVDLALFYAERPVDELHCASFKLLSACCRQVNLWGVNLMFLRDDYVRGLTNRSLNMSKIAKEWRFCVVQAAVTNPKFSESKISMENREKLTKFLKVGPFLGPYSRDHQDIQATVEVI